MKELKRFIPIVIVLACIAFFTMQSPSGTLFVSVTLRKIWIKMMPDFMARWANDMHWFRSLLHLPLYFILGIVVSLAFHKFWKAAGICSVVALSDEILKIFLPTREFEARDIVIDAVGFMVGILFVTLIRIVKKRALEQGREDLVE